MTMLERWAACCDDHAAIEEFWDYVSRRHDLGCINIRDLLAEYYAIDRAQLDRERRELLKPELRRQREIAQGCDCQDPDNGLVSTQCPIHG